MDESWFRWALGLSKMKLNPEIYRNYNHIYWHIGRFQSWSLGCEILYVPESKEIEMQINIFNWRAFLSIDIKGRFDAK
jgi:hypothetical protein